MGRNRLGVPVKGYKNQSGAYTFQVYMDESLFRRLSDHVVSLRPVTSLAAFCRMAIENELDRAGAPLGKAADGQPVASVRRAEPVVVPPSEVEAQAAE